MNEVHHYCSTKDANTHVSLKEAIFQGLAPDNGLFLPAQIKSLPDSFFLSLHNKNFREIAYDVSRHILGEEIPPDVLRNLVEESFSFEVPLIDIEENIRTLELFHGPTLSFKDFGARFMARLTAYYRKGASRLHILAATSGDTGSAVADGFYNIPGIDVWVLYPAKKISAMQEKQITNLGNNIHAIEIDGNFDDCQHLVKSAFGDKELRTKMNLTSANSINIARLIPQTFYYFHAFSHSRKNIPLVISVPSGNFGNLTAGLLAKKMGLKIHRFIAATNSNDIVPKYLETGQFSPGPSKHTVSNAMDVGDPSNFSRILSLYDHCYEDICKDIYGASFTDAETVEAIAALYKKTGYIADPHGAVGYLGLKKYLKGEKNPVSGIFLETAHPAKFSDTIKTAINIDPKIPERLQKSLESEKKGISLPNDYAAFKEILIRNH